ncbi:blood group Rh(CE) polypeptide isoform X1 [Otolemur garnettii]|uniref:blood group Rh(CE) polypeptide isoform X1 n=1 Tax=Otolemur garnettii TaxID=30611 RepID=UPI0002742392|nr:blood group Rh(CE) polypeptide isoform X1 [Otolemur garnettii]
MGSKYQPSLRGCLPLWALTLEAALILIFFFFATYDTSSKDQKHLMEAYRAFQDVTVMAALGMGFLTSSLWRHVWSSVGFSLFMLVLGVQWAVLLDGFLENFSPEKIIITLARFQQATMSATSVLISAGAVLGKANLVQLLVMALLEVTAFGTMRTISKRFLSMDDHSNMMHIYTFAAYFGLTVAYCLSRPLPKGAEEKNRTATSPSLFAMLGTLFLWTFWPSFNSALLNDQNEMKNAIFNTYYALAVSTVTAISVSAWTHPRGKINMTHVHNAVLAGGVAVGASCHLIPSPWLAMVLGLVAGLISTGGAKCLPMCFNRVLGIHDTCGVHYTFGLPGLLGGIISIVMLKLHINWTNSPITGNQVPITFQALGMVWCLASSLVTGLLTGLLLNLKIWKAPDMTKYFDDQAFWKFPHLAVDL